MAAKIFINGRFLTQPITGVQRYARELLKAWDGLLDRGEIDRRAFAIEVLAPRGTLAPPPLSRISIRQVGRLRGHLWEQLELPFYVRTGMLFSPGNIHPLLAPLLAPGAVTIHDLAYKLYPESYTKAFRLAYGVMVPAAMRRASAVITVSDAERRNLLVHYPAAAARIAAIHSGAPARAATAPVDSPPAEPFALWVGTHIARKNPRGAIDAMLRVNLRRTLPLVMVGASYKGLAATGCAVPRGGDRTIRMVNRLDTFAEIAELYRTAVCLLFPSFYEGFGLPALEAMAYGCPVVASDIPVLREVCGNAAIFCDPHDPDDIAAKVDAVAASPALRDELRRLGYARVAQFSWDRCARETFAVLHRVIAGADPAGSTATPSADAAAAS